MGWSAVADTNQLEHDTWNFVGASNTLNHRRPTRKRDWNMQAKQSAHQRVRHGRSAHVEPVVRVRRLVVMLIRAPLVLVKAAPERSRMRRRRTHTRLPRRRDRAVLLGNSDGPVRGDGAVLDGEPHGRGESAGGVEIDTCRRRGAVVVVVLVVVVAVVVLVFVEKGRRRRREAGAGGGGESGGSGLD